MKPPYFWNEVVMLYFFGKDKTMNLYQKEKILPYLANQDLPIFPFNTITSTNTYAKQLLQENQQPPFLVISSEQTAGRGRGDHSFYSPQNGFYYTLVVSPSLYQDLGLVTIASAVSLQQAIQQDTSISCGIKWVNDLYFEQKKVAGILCEAYRNSKQELQAIIIGIGVNLDIHYFPEEIQEIAGSLGLASLDKNQLAAHLTNQLLHWLQQEKSVLLEEYHDHCIVLGKEVSFLWNGEEITGIAKKINDEGNLIVDSNQTQYTLHSGEISLKKW